MELEVGYGVRGVELLTALLDAAHKETQAQTQKQIGEDRAQNGSLDDRDQIPVLRRAIVIRCLVFGDEQHEQHNLDNRPQRSLNQDARHLGQLPRQLLASEAQQIRRRHHADVADPEDPTGQAWKAIV